MKSAAAVVAVINKLAERDNWRVSDLARAIGRDKSATFRLLRTLMSYDWVRKSESSPLYSIGPAILDLSDRRSLPRAKLLAVAQPLLLALAERYDETVYLSRRQGTQNLVEFVRESTQEVRAVSEVGRVRPLHCGCSGKAHLAYAHQSVIDKVVGADLPAYTVHTITEPAALLAELARIRERGWSFENEEFAYGVNGVAVPIWWQENTSVGCIGIRAPSSRLTFEVAQGIVPDLIDASAEISKALRSTG